MNKCQHTLGHYDTDRYDCMETTFVSLSDLSLEYATKLNSSDATKFNFCPHCGLSLEGLMESRVEEIKADNLKRKKQEEADKLVAQEKFNKTVTELSLKTKLNLLPTGNFIVIFHPFKPHESRDFLLSGPKDLILRNSVLCTSNDLKARENLKVKAIYKNPSVETLTEILIKNNFKQTSQNIFTSFERVSEFKTEHLSYSEADGIIYITIKTTDSEGYKNTNYEHFAAIRLGDYLKTEFTLEEIKLDY